MNLLVNLRCTLSTSLIRCGSVGDHTTHPYSNLLTISDLRSVTIKRVKGRWKLILQSTSNIFGMVIVFNQCKWP